MQTLTAETPDVEAAHTITVGIAARDAVTRRRIAAIATADGLAVNQRAASPRDLIRASADGALDVAIVTGSSARDIVTSVRALSDGLPDTRIVVVLPSAERQPIWKVLRAGAQGAVIDQELETALGWTLRAVQAGQLCVPDELRNHVEKPVLSYREKQILGMVVMGFGNSEIAGKLYLAESTVKSHLSSAFGKLGVRSRSEAATMILDPEHALGTGILAISDGETPWSRAGAIG